MGEYVRLWATMNKYPIAWDDVRVNLDPEMNGTLPGVVVEHVAMEDWQAVLGLANTQGWTYEYPGDAGNRDDLPYLAVKVKKCEALGGAAA